MKKRLLLLLASVGLLCSCGKDAAPAQLNTAVALPEGGEALVVDPEDEESVAAAEKFVGDVTEALDPRASMEIGEDDEDGIVYLSTELSLDVSAAWDHSDSATYFDGSYDRVNRTVGSVAASGKLKLEMYGDKNSYLGEDISDKHIVQSMMRLSLSHFNLGVNFYDYEYRAEGAEPSINETAIAFAISDLSLSVTYWYEIGAKEEGYLLFDLSDPSVIALVDNIYYTALGYIPAEVLQSEEFAQVPMMVEMVKQFLVANPKLVLKQSYVAALLEALKDKVDEDEMESYAMVQELLKGNLLIGLEEMLFNFLQSEEGQEMFEEMPSLDQILPMLSGMLGMLNPQMAVYEDEEANTLEYGMTVNTGINDEAFQLMIAQMMMGERSREEAQEPEMMLPPMDLSIGLFLLVGNARGTAEMSLEELELKVRFSMAYADNDVYEDHSSSENTAVAVNAVVGLSMDYNPAHCNLPELQETDFDLGPVIDTLMEMIMGAGE